MCQVRNSRVNVFVAPFHSTLVGARGPVVRAFDQRARGLGFDSLTAHGPVVGVVVGAFDQRA
jgi:hypothetical protein